MIETRHLTGAVPRPWADAASPFRRVVSRAHFTPRTHGPSSANFHCNTRARALTHPSPFTLMTSHASHPAISSSISHGQGAHQLPIYTQVQVNSTTHTLPLRNTSRFELILEPEKERGPERMTSGGSAVMSGGGNAKVSLRLQYCVVLAGVAAVVVIACLKYMPAAAVAAVGYGFWGGGGQQLGTAGGGGSVAGRGGAAAAAASTASSATASGRPQPQVVIFNFGDSNSDTGGMAAALGMNIALPEGRTYFRRPTGRLSDGRLVIDFFCESLNTPHLSPYLKALGSDFSNGVNFAMGGSTATPGGSPFSLNVQLRQFLFFRTRSLELINQGQRTPINREGFQNAIYTIDIGQNDVSAYLHLPYDKVLAKIPPIVAHIKYTIEALYGHGARKFWIHGMGALGCLPQKLAIPRDDDSVLDGNGCLKTYNNAAKSFNQQLSKTCNQLRQRMVDATIVFTDMFAIKYDLVANHTKYGIEKPLMACCGYGGPPYNYNHFKACMSAEMQLCDMDTRFISWDGVHFTEAGNAVVAAKVLTGDYSKPRITLASLVNSTRANDG